MDTTDVAIVLHSRRYRENSRIVELFSADHGRVAVVGRVSAKSMASRFQPFTELEVGWSGRRELKTLKNADVKRQWSLLGRASVCGLYLNELLLYLLGKELASPELYDAYTQALNDLSDDKLDLAATLRRFEKVLLDELGYLPALHLDEEVVAERLYFSPSQGISEQSFVDSVPVSVHAIEALASDDFHRQSAAKEIKLMLSSCIDRLLNGKPLRSRELIRSMSKKSQ